MWSFGFGGSAQARDREKELEHAQLNHALALAVDRGRSPALASMAAAYPALSSAQREQFDAIARAAIDASYKVVEQLSEATRTLEFEEWKGRFSPRFAWVSDANLSRLFGEGSYYAWHEGLFPRPPDGAL